VLIALQQTGARPSEVVSVTAADCDLANGLWVLDSHKTDGGGKPRVVALTPQMVELCRDLAARYPVGPLFRNSRGNPYRPIAISNRVRELRIKLGITGVIPYGYRHTFATDALAAGVPDAQVAGLLGHASTKMLYKHYSHLTARVTVLRLALGTFRGESEQKDGTTN
jgi:integrase